MNISQKTEYLRKLTKDHGKLKLLAAEIGVSFGFLNKFTHSPGRSPTVRQVSKIEDYFDRKERRGEL